MMNSSCTDMEENEFEYVWRINKFSVHSKCTKQKRDTTMLRSANFTVGIINRTEWHLNLDIHGTLNEHSSFGGLYLISDSVHEVPEIWACYTFVIVSNEGEEINCASNEISRFAVSPYSGWGRTRYIEIKKIMEDSDTYLPNDQMTILCRGKVFGNAITRNEDCHLSSATKINLSYDLINMLQNEKLSDITFIVSGRRICAHKIILSARSPVFAAMFESPMAEAGNSEVKVDDIDPEVFDVMLRYIYTDQVSNMTEIAVELLAAADKYELVGLMEMCEEFLCKSIDVENAAETLVIADRHNVKRLLEYIYNFMNIHIVDVMATSGYERMVKEYPQISTTLLQKLILKRISVLSHSER